MIKTLIRVVLFFSIAGLPLTTQSQSQPSLKHGVVITELYPDPDTKSKIPMSEFVELKNVSRSTINLKGWKIADASNSATIATSFDLKPDSFLVICPQSAVNHFRAFGSALGLTGFPSLNNDEDHVSLYDPAGNLVHHVHYEDSWYRNDVKKEGGWTLEIMDPLNFCSGSSNWQASENSNGGTPGSTNSINRSNPDQQPPVVLKSYAIDSLTILLFFDEPLDSTTSANILNYRFNLTKHIVQTVVPVGPSFSEVKLIMKVAMKPGEVDELTITRLTDCAGNTIGSVNKVKCGIATVPEKNDVILNELLFDPEPGGYDYVELYNRSTKVIDLREILLGSRSATGTLINMKAVVEDDRMLFPGEYLVVTENVLWVRQHYVVKHGAAVSIISDLPSMPDDKGNVAVIDRQGFVIDEISYSDKWHFALINNREGVALERIDHAMPTNEKTNWTSAASAAGFGTPGYQNSQFRADLQATGTLVTEPKLFSPDNDGIYDHTAFKYEMAEPGYMGSITIYDAGGRPVRYLVKSQLLGMKGVYNWDGLDENLKKLPVGVYIVLMEFFNLKGQVKRIKQAITLARKIQ